MPTGGRLDESISTWLEQTAPGRLPDRVLEATFERTRGSRQQVGWRARLGRIHVTRSVAALGGVAAVVVVAATLALGSVADRPGVGGPPISDDPRAAFLGTWFSTSDADGGTQTMTARATLDGGVEIVVTDDVASVCSRTASTMTGTGRLEGDTRLVIPAPVYSCDNGREPQALSGPPLSEQLRNLTFVRDPQADVLTVGAASVWTREVAAAPRLDPAPSLAPRAWDTMWPQTSLEEVRQAQALADAGDPAYMWQVDPQLSDRFVDQLREPGRAEIAERFLREELGWDKFLFQDVWGERAADGIPGVTYVRCGPGDTNRLYPDAPVDLFGSPIAEPCAPSIDELRYETVSLDLAQPGLAGPTGIWVVSGWRRTEPFAQADPDIARAEGQARVENYLRARIAGKGAEGGVFVRGPYPDLPLLYATTSGASYERYEIERVSGPTWPFGAMVLNVRLFADGGKTVVEQQIQWNGTGLDAPTRTLEDGQLVPLPTASPTVGDGVRSVPVECGRGHRGRLQRRPCRAVPIGRH